MSARPDLPSMSGLRAFEAAGRHLNFRAAADELGVTQGAVAQQVRALEEALGARLFERRSRGVSFTSPGRAYHEAVGDAFGRLREATALLRPGPAKVTISVTPTFASRWLIPNLPDFTARHPDIDFRVLSTERVLSFHGDGIDLAVRQGRPPFGARLDAVRLFRQSVVAVASPELVAGRTLPLADREIAELPLLHDTHNLWPEFLRRAGIGAGERRRRNLHFSQTGLSVEAALAGQGLALASRFLVEGDLRAGRLVQVIDGSYAGTDDFHLLAPRAADRSPAVAVVREWLLSRGDPDACGPSPVAGSTARRP